jgi:surfactin synthase thioesterase subunit
MDDASLLGELIELGGTPDASTTCPSFASACCASCAPISRCSSRAPGRPPDSMLPWARESRGGFGRRLYPGGHFYFLGPAFAGLVRDIVREIEPRLEARTALPDSLAAAHGPAQSAPPSLASANARIVVRRIACCIPYVQP